MRICIFVMAIGFAVAVGGAVCAEETPEEGSPREPFALDWWSMDGGGGPAAGGDFVLIATIGQPDVGAAIGEDYLLQGGFLAGGDLGVLFVDGFERGSAVRWDSVVGAPLW